MGGRMDQVQRFIAAGASIPNAIKVALDQAGMSLAAFGLKYGVARSHVSRAIGGAERPGAGVLRGLVEELGGSEDQWRLLLHEAGRPAVAAAAL